MYDRLRVSGLLLLWAMAAHAGPAGDSTSTPGSTGGTLTRIGSCGGVSGPQECFTFCPANSVLAAPSGAPGAVNCLTLTRAYVPPELAFITGTPVVNGIATWVDPSTNELRTSNIQINQADAIIAPQSATIPGRIGLYELSGGGTERVLVSAPTALTVSRNITFKTATGAIKADDVQFNTPPAAIRAVCASATDGSLFLGDDAAGCPAGTTTSTSSTSTTSSSTTSSTVSGGCADSATILNTTDIDDYWTITSTNTLANITVASGYTCQRISNSASLSVCELKVCLGHDGTAGTGNIQFGVFTDKTSGCAAGSWCPETQLGDLSELYDIAGLSAATNDLTVEDGGACGTDNNGKSVTVGFATDPNPTGNFWVCGIWPGSGAPSEPVRWGSTFNPGNPGFDYSDTDFDLWQRATIDFNQDFSFTVRVD